MRVADWHKLKFIENANDHYLTLSAAS